MKTQNKGLKMYIECVLDTIIRDIDFSWFSFYAYEMKQKSNHIFKVANNKNLTTFRRCSPLNISVEHESGWFGQSNKHIVNVNVAP